MTTKTLFAFGCSLVAGYLIGGNCRQAAAQSMQEKIAGKWIIDLGESEKLDQSAAAVVSQMRSLGIQMGFDFQPDEKFAVTFTIDTNTTSHTGTWKVTKATTRKLLMEMTLEGSQAAKKISILRIDDDHYRMDTETRDPGKRHSVILKRPE